MAALLVSNSSCYGCHAMQKETERLANEASISMFRIGNVEPCRNVRTSSKRSFRISAEVRPTEAEKLGTNGRAKIVPSKELVSRNGRPKTNGIDVNGSKVVTNGSNIIRRADGASSALVRTRKTMVDSDELPFLEEMKELPSDEGFSWAKDNYNSVQRSIDVWSFVLSFRLRVLFDNEKWAYVDGFTEEKQKSRRRKTASWLREQVLQLGPTFIKLGQLSSTRSDLFPREFVDELAKLQDRVPAFSPEKAKSFVENELGESIDVLFKKFEDRPIAAASLGQMHLEIFEVNRACHTF